METRKAVEHNRFVPFGEGVLLKAERVRAGRILIPDNLKDEADNVVYKKLEVVAYGGVTRWVSIGDVVKLSDFSMATQAPEIVWQDEEGDPDKGEEVTIDYLLIPEIFIRGKWTAAALAEENE